MLRMGFVDTRTVYEREQLQWVHDGGPGDIIAVCAVGDKSDGAVWNPKSGGY